MQPLLGAELSPLLAPTHESRQRDPLWRCCWHAETHVGLIAVAASAGVAPASLIGAGDSAVHIGISQTDCRSWNLNAL